MKEECRFLEAFVAACIFPDQLAGGVRPEAILATNRV
jgi:hypothetical protein